VESWPTSDTQVCNVFRVMGSRKLALIQTLVKVSDKSNLHTASQFSVRQDESSAAHLSIYSPLVTIYTNNQQVCILPTEVSYDSQNKQLLFP